MIINGLPGDSIPANDRGLMYGDGVFRTFLVHNGKPIQWQRQFSKLQHDCAELGIKCPTIQLLESDLQQLLQDGIAQNSAAVVKIIISRGPSNRGYAAAANPKITRILSINPIPNYPASFNSLGIKVHICNLRIGHQPRLAGIKHLNRLENVLAATEWNDAEISEGILLDEDEHIIEGTRSNLFLVRNGKLYTPDLSKCGVAGIQRERVIDYARQHQIVCKITELTMDDLLSADEIFMVNSVIGLWPVREFPRFSCNNFPVSLQIQDWLNNGSD